jgi:murein DD-endopeptidase MepM/ murein hydrolase activator NlpD
VGRVVRLAAVVAAAFVFVLPASAMTDGGRGMSLIWPADGTVTRGFGYDPTMAESHPGIDVGTLQSLAVRAAGPGRVEAVGYAGGFDGYGNIVLVDMGSGLQALYAHLSLVHAHVGESVSTGSYLGLAGCTGYCTGTHLHFELRDDGVAFDPAPLLPPQPN